MSHGHCSCPDCGTILRVRDRTFVGRQIQCPECKIHLVIKLNEDRGYLAERPKADPKPATLKRLAVPASRIRVAIQQRLGHLARSPLVMAWALAIGVTAFAAIVMLRPSVRFQNSGNPRLQESAQQDSQPAQRGVGFQPTEKSTPSPETTTTVAANDSSTQTVPETVTKKTESPANVTSPDPPVVADAANPANVASAIGPARGLQPVVPAKTKIDFGEKLKQRIFGFATREPRSRALLIEQVEEMLGARIRYNRDELGEKNLERTININLENTTVGGILNAVLDSANWDFVIEETELRLKPRQVAGPNP